MQRHQPSFSIEFHRFAFEQTKHIHQNRRDDNVSAFLDVLQPQPALDVGADVCTCEGKHAAVGIGIY